MDQLSLLYPRQSAVRRVSSLDGMWRFQFDPEGAGASQGWTAGLPDPVSMPVPASFADLFTDRDSRDYTGDFWYETDFFVPGEWAGMDLLIRFGSATHRARVFVNGAEAAVHEGGFLPFDADVTGLVKYNAYNKLSVLLDNQLSEETLPAGLTFRHADGRKAAAPYFDFFNYAGLHRPVKLTALPRERVLDYSVVHELRGPDALVRYAVVTSGTHEIAVELYDGAERVAEARGGTGTLKVQNVKLWELHKGFQYTLVLRIVDGERVLDEYAEPLGIRTFELRDGKFLLNGRPVYLRGFGKHEDGDIRGRGLDLSTVKRDFELMRWIGANCFRTSHYPYAEEVYQMADEYGVLVIDEVPAVGFRQSTSNFLVSAQGVASDEEWFEKKTTPRLLENHKQALREMIARDKNHASVVAWSLLNEPLCTSRGTEDYFQAVFDLTQELDPQKRPRTYANVIEGQPHLSRGQRFSDFLSLNRYYGWYNLGPSLCDAEAAFRRELDQWDEVRDGRPVVITEYGADTQPDEHKLPSVMWSQEYQDEYLEMNHRVFDSYDWIQGELVWNFADFQTIEGIMRVNGNKKGIFTRQRQPKDAAYALRARWTDLPDWHKSER